MPNSVLPGFIYINWLIPINPLVATIIIPIFVDKETEAHRGQITYPSGKWQSSSRVFSLYYYNVMNE